jgi:Prp8 binding protein
MSAEKRPADEYSSSQMVVKRPNLGKDGKAVAIVSGSGGNGALIQAVCIILEDGGCTC